MADRDCNADIPAAKDSPKIIRRYKVSYASKYPDYSRMPCLTLKGQWLEEAGFTTGTVVDVRVMNGCLVITAREAEQEEPKLFKSLRKLSARKQKQVAEFIGVVAGKRS